MTEDVEDIEFKRLDHKCSLVCTSRDVAEVTAFINDPSRKILVMGVVQSPNPIFTFDEALLPPEIMRVIAAKGWTEPTAVQAIALPIILLGRDMICVAKTGSSQTSAFAIPAVLHVMQNRSPGSFGPYAAVLCPTRESVVHIYSVLSQFAGAFGLKTACLYAGRGTRSDQARLCRSHPDFVIGSPGRIRDLAEAESLSLRSVSFVVINEVDSLLYTENLNQLRTVFDSCQRGRQTLILSATQPRELLEFADEFLRTDRMLVRVGWREWVVNQSIKQTILQVDDPSRFDSLLMTLDRLYKETNGGMKLIIFVNSEQAVEELAGGLYQRQSMAVCTLHSDMTRSAQDQSKAKFRRTPRKCCLVATAVAQRGLNVDGVSHVIVYNMPYYIDDYVYMIGRTARARGIGETIAFFSRKWDKPISKELVAVLQQGRQEVPAWLQELAD
jgi:superfamily II DNA/RNA helicase